MLNNLEMCKACVPWIYPLVFDDCCLTIPQQIAKIQMKVNEIIDTINKSDEDIKEYIDSEINSAIQTCNNYTNEKINEEVSVLLAEIKSVRDYAYNLDALQRNYIDNKLNEVFYEIRNLQNLCGIIVIDPTTGMQNSLQGALDNMYNYFRYFALTANRYDLLQLTADEYDSYNVSAYDYDYYGLLIFKNAWFRNMFYMFHPATGEYVNYKTVIYWLTDFHRTNALTATEYDNKNITATNYDSLDITAYNYDFNGGTLIN